MLSTSRRRFLEVVTAGGAAVFILPACGSNGGGGATAKNVGDVQAGTVADLPVGTLRAVGASPVAIGRDSGGLYAMTLTCTHAGCNIATHGSVSPSGIVCSCHGSQYDANGDVTNPPASAPLAHFAVEVDSSGNVIVHSGTEVDASTRTPVA
jgi:cytochrome b6-f complex iron-sulfur subunit